MSAQGYVLPIRTDQPPRQLNLVQFLQTVLVGVTGLPGTLVRPKWQMNPPKQPDIGVDWVAFNIDQNIPDANGYLGVTNTGAVISQRHEVLEVGCAIYGDKSMETAGLIRDGFQIPQNVNGLRSANMGFVEVGPAHRVPDLVNERWVNRYQMSIFLRREIQRTYPILTLLSAHGTIHSVTGNESYLSEWQTGDDE